MRWSVLLTGERSMVQTPPSESTSSPTRPPWVKFYSRLESWHAVRGSGKEGKDQSDCGGGGGVPKKCPIKKLHSDLLVTKICYN
jgi:hypothetical protein